MLTISYNTLTNTNAKKILITYDPFFVLSLQYWHELFSMFGLVKQAEKIWYPRGRKFTF